MADQKKQEMLSKEGVDRFMERWINDPRFPGQLKADPHAAFSSVGLEAGPELVAAMRAMDGAMPFEELRERVSKGTTLNCHRQQRLQRI